MILYLMLVHHQAQVLHKAQWLRTERLSISLMLTAMRRQNQAHCQDLTLHMVNKYHKQQSDHWKNESAESKENQEKTRRL